MACFAPYAPLDRDVQIMLATPQRPQRSKRRLQAEVSDTADKELPPAKARRGAQGSCTETNLECSKATASAQQAAEALEKEAALLAKLFDGLESVLVLLASRRARPTVASVRTDVGHLTGREMTDERLEQILAVADRMLETPWVRGSLELVQRLENGETRPPTNVEKAQRHSSFSQRLATVVKEASLERRGLPRCPLPTRPATEAQRVAAQHSATTLAPSVVEGAAVPTQAGVSRAEAGAAGGSRLEALRQRILVRQDSDHIRKEHQAKIAAVEDHISTCEDAIAVYAVLMNFFARGEGADSAASEAEVIAGICSSGFAMQSRRPLDAKVARAALAHLTSKAGDWYVAHSPQHSQRTGLILRRVPDGCSLSSMEALQAEIRDLQEEKKMMVLGGPTMATESASIAVAAKTNELTPSAEVATAKSVAKATTKASQPKAATRVAAAAAGKATVSASLERKAEASRLKTATQAVASTPGRKATPSASPVRKVAQAGVAAPGGTNPVSASPVRKAAQAAAAAPARQPTASASLVRKAEAKSAAETSKAAPKKAPFAAPAAPRGKPMGSRRRQRALNPTD